jgi:multiple sugar transport system permease protein
MTTRMASLDQSLSIGSPLRRQMRKFTASAAVTTLAVAVVSVFLLPLLFMTSTAFKDKVQLTTPGAPLWPAAPQTFAWRGADYPVFDVPTDTGLRALALIDPGREQSTFVDPAAPDAEPLVWTGRWRTLQQHWGFSLDLRNFGTAWDAIAFPRLLFNTFVIAALSTVGAVLSSVCVAYGFSRFRFPGRNGLFLVLLSTIILPLQVTLIPTFAVYAALGWVGTWLPLIVPHFFANAYNVFLLRQYFLTIPRELDEAAMIDGAGPFRILRSVVVPQARAAIVAVSLFHFFWAWNEFFLPLIYLQGDRELQPLSVGIAEFNGAYSTEPTLIQAAAVMALVIPVVVFFLAQRAFMRGVVITGVDK